MEGNYGREHGSEGIRRSSRSIGVAREIEVETLVRAASEDKVHVTVAAEFKAGKATLLWAINNNSRNKTFVLVHVHVRAQMIPIMGGMFHISTLSGEQINAYRQLERDKTEEVLDEYLTLCSQLKVRAEKLVIERDDVARGLTELIAEVGITKLVMEAALDKRYSKEASVHASRLEPVSGHCKQLRSSFSPSRKNVSFNLLCNPSQNSYKHSSFNLLNTPNQDTEIIMTGSSTDDCKGSCRTPHSSDNLSASVIDEALSNYRSVSSSSDVNSEDQSVSSCPLQDFEDSHELSSLDEQQDSDSDTDVFTKFQATLKEVESLKHETHEESCKRRRAEMQLILSRQKAKATENLYAKEVRYRKEIEEALDREKLEVEKLKNQQAVLLEQLQNAIEKKVEVELKLAESDQTSKDFEEKLSGACYRLNSLQDENYDLQRERDDLVKEFEVLRQNSDKTSSGYYWPFKTEFSYMELVQATQNFSNSLKIGEDASGKVYKGFLRNTTVAIRILNTKILQGQAEFNREVNVISRMKHPNIVTLIGACFDAFALIYEFVPNGSIEDYLTDKYSNLLLTWKVRIRLIAEICSALIFLHSNKSHPGVHGDLKPANILLDANFVCKVGDFGISRFLDESSSSTSLYTNMHGKGISVYTDPEFFSTGELTPLSDVYSFGIIILRLLTGKPANGVAREVQEALNRGYLHTIIDPSAGAWPFVQAKQLAHLGLRCCDQSKRNRPDLVAEVLRVVEPMMKAALLHVSSLSLGSYSDDNYSIPSYFMCPIFQEIMKDPHMAADGFTYEAEAIRGWIDSGHDTSPMTNLRLHNCELIPNRALRSVIQEWLQQQQQEF